MTDPIIKRLEKLFLTEGDCEALRELRELELEIMMTSLYVVWVAHKKKLTASGTSP